MQYITSFLISVVAGVVCYYIGKLGSPALIKEKRIPRELQLSGDSLCDIMHIASFLH